MKFPKAYLALFLSLLGVATGSAIMTTRQSLVGVSIERIAH